MEREKRFIVQGENVGLRGTTRERYIERRIRFGDDPFASALQYVNAMPPFPPEHWERMYEERVVTRSELVFEVIRLEDGECVGEVTLRGLKYPDASCQLGLWIIDETLRGQGFGWEGGVLAVAYAFDGLNVHRMWLRFLASNKAIAHLAERFPGKRVAHLRESAFAFGRWEDEIIWDCLKHEWPPHPATAALRGETPREPVGV